MPGSDFNTFAVTEDYETQMTNGSGHSGIFVSTDGA